MMMDVLHPRNWTDVKDDAQNNPWENVQETQGIDGKTYGKTRRLAGKWQFYVFLGGQR